jgi:hypothetical protein
MAAYATTTKFNELHKKSGAFFSFPQLWKEKRFIRESSLEVLKLYVLERSANPKLNRRNLYIRVAARYLDVNNEAAEKVVRRAEESYASWPCERDLKLIDLAHYMIVNEYIDNNDIGVGLGPHFKEIVEELVPYNY